MAKPVEVPPSETKIGGQGSLPAGRQGFESAEADGANRFILLLKRSYFL
ncbi:MAG: hypothetical protein WCV72_00185 [Patescibacteria group bacterium]|jgi:hypothetical protein